MTRRLVLVKYHVLNLATSKHSYYRLFTELFQNFVNILRSDLDICRDDLDLSFDVETNYSRDKEIWCKQIALKTFEF